MGYLGRRIGLSQGRADAGDPQGGDTGGGLLDLFANGYFQREGNIFNSSGQSATGLTATGGVIADYPQSGFVYRAHIFTSSGTFDVTALGNLGNQIEYLVVGGGGGGGGNSSQASRAGGGGGGAGGLRSTDPAIPAPTRATALTAAVQSYPIVVGAGGAGGPLNNGGPSSLGPISVLGGGGANNYTGSAVPGPAGNPGGSGGGGSGGSPGAPGVGNGGNGADVGSANQQGFPGGTGYHVANVYVYGGGGGGASAAGTNAPGSGAPLTGNTAGNGGDGYTVSILGPTLPAAFAGGGGGGAQGGPTSATGGNGGLGGGGAGVSQPAGTARTGGAGYNAGENYPNPENLGGKGGYSTGGGGGGSGTPTGTFGGHGGSGIVVARYKIGTVETGNAKASGGAISFYNNKTIHTFTNTGTFTANEALTVEYVVVGGGGGGRANSGGYGSGGGGAGGYRTGTGVPVGAGAPNAVTVTVGAGGLGAQGTASSFGPSYPATGGGYGGGASTAGGPGGSGGGGGGYSGGPGPSDPLGNPGGSGAGNPGPIYSQYGGGGGGAGGPGASGDAQPNPAKGGDGGVGLQVPTTFRNPATTYDPGAQWYLAGGGGGSAAPGATADTGVAGTGGDGGGGRGAYNDAAVSPSVQYNAIDGSENTGGGGGGPFGSSGNPDSGVPVSIASKGGSGIVLIAYPT